jgi:hypothetical protein
MSSTEKPKSEYEKKTDAEDRASRKVVEAALVFRIGLASNLYGDDLWDQGDDGPAGRFERAIDEWLEVTNGFAPAAGVRRFARKPSLAFQLARQREVKVYLPDDLTEEEREFVSVFVRTVPVDTVLDSRQVAPPPNMSRPTAPTVPVEIITAAEKLSDLCDLMAKRLSGTVVAQIGPVVAQPDPKPAKETKAETDLAQRVARAAGFEEREAANTKKKTGPKVGRCFATVNPPARVKSFPLCTVCKRESKEPLTSEGWCGNCRPLKKVDEDFEDVPIGAGPLLSGATKP